MLEIQRRGGWEGERVLGSCVELIAVTIAEPTKKRKVLPPPRTCTAEPAMDLDALGGNGDPRVTGEDGSHPLLRDMPKVFFCFIQKIEKEWE